MPTLVVDRIPLPSLRFYTILSILWVSVCLYYSVKVTRDPDWKLHTNNTSIPVGTLPKIPEGVADVDRGEQIDIEGVLESAVKMPEEPPDGLFEEKATQKDLPDIELEERIVNDTRTLGAHLRDVVTFMSQEPTCIWTLINMAYCCLILLGKSIQKVVFGELRISEQQHLKDKFWNFVFYKFIFVFGVVNVQFLNEVVLWVSWFSILGFLHLLSQLCKDRFEYLSFSPTTPGWSHFRLVALLSAILTLSGLMFIISIGVGLFHGINTFAFMASECVLLSIRTLHVLVRYGLFLYDMRNGGLGGEAVSWDKRGPVAYYIELGFEVAALLVDLLHHLHMLFWSNIFLSMASLVIVMQLRYLIHEIQRKIKKHRNYLWVLNHMEKSYPLATAKDLSENSDNCAICWEKMESARKLPCSHLFHNSCLQSWLEQDTSCPTCRLALSVQNNVTLHPNMDRIDEPETAGRANNHFFHFNGSRYVSWLPNFSVEVTNINNMLRNEPPTHTHTSQIRNMALQVQQMFPRYPLTVIIGDLTVTRSIEITIDNILEGRLQVPARFQELEGDDFGEPGSRASSSDASPDNSGAFAANSASDYYVNPVFSRASTSSSSSEPGGYEVERKSNIFGNQSDLLRDDSVEDVPLGDRFSKSSEERERILQRRKEMLVALARKKYLDRNRSELNLRHRTKSNLQE
ncbi:E3 ubiquitin-protein ligase AMFR-like isoform X2 [Phlebotomus argentipes]|uniref:E3 ubiquitin-protein ligase AMFR-like isoform X2 n=1 Tax=Phlebotomus argentipes TaxID=94469 RepID=UPI0028931CCE|nr:E3 ubiquitin-protein ligase AMFR-like isoform X2 [Phlebotomus argentipes]